MTKKQEDSPAASDHPGSGQPDECADKNTHNVVERVLFDGVAPEQRAGMRVLDLPCGSGAFSARVAARGARVTGGDIVDGLATRDGIDFAVADMDAPLSFPDESFSHVVCIDGIEHIERQFDFVRECRRVLEDDGRLIISTPNISSARSRWRYFLTGHHNKCKSPLNERHVTPLHHKGMISFPELRYLLHTNGFVIETITTNRVKGIAWLFAPLWPFSWLTTLRVYHREEGDPGQRSRNREILGAMHRVPVYFGESLIVAARRVPS